MEKDTIQVVAVGDIMMGTMYPDGKYLPPDSNCSRSFSMVKPYFENADILFGNLEGALVNSLTGVKSCNNPAVCYTFGMPAKFAGCLVDAGFDMISLANNHMGDFGETGRRTTVETLEKHGIAHAGLITHPTSIVEKDGIKYGFCAFAPNRGTVDVRDIPAAQDIVRSLKDSCDIVIVSFHAGAEGPASQHVTRETETFLGENRGNVYEFAHKMIDAGGDILLGHGPHVTRAVEIYNDRFIAYSMGNFSTYSRINVAGVTGLAPIFRIYTNRHGCFFKAHITPTYQPMDDRCPRYDSARRVVSVIRDLTRQDFPEVNIEISEDGWIIHPEGTCMIRLQPILLEVPELKWNYPLLRVERPDPLDKSVKTTTSRKRFLFFRKAK
ncbi:MAG: CapA family protein [Bacteroidales bacterium]|jgi:poly-gamma-glutamate capsule biosynthesis protein CapA/YwtB (metallophosphatase superfamily)|nr:CapA family protein [Bacteroidales bacterium]